MSDAVSFQTVIEYVEARSSEEQDLLVELLHKRRVEQRRREIATNAVQTIAALKAGKAKRGSLADLRADLMGEE